MCLTIFNHVYTFFNPIRIARMAFGQKVPFGPIKLISGRDISNWFKRPKLTPWMWNTMINQVQPMLNPLRFAWNAIWDPTVLRDFWSLQGPFKAPQIPQNGSQTQKKWTHQLTIITKTILIINKVQLKKNPNFLHILLLGTLCPLNEKWSKKYQFLYFLLILPKNLSFSDKTLLDWVRPPSLSKKNLSIFW